MGFRQSFMLAIKSLATSKVRALLTMLGIIIGVAAVIVIISLGDGLQATITDSFESMGTNLLMVNVMGRNSSRRVTEEEMFELVDKNTEYLSAVSPVVSIIGTTKIGSEVLKTTTVTGVSEQYVEIKNLELSSGRFLQYIDVLKMGKVCVIGSYINKEYLSSNGIGQTVRIAGNNYTVVGILDEKADSAEGTDDDYIYIPYTNAQRINRNAKTTSYYFSTVSTDTTSVAKWLIENKLQSVFEDKDAYNIISMSEMLSTVTEIQDTLLSVLVAIAGISLFVGGIGIMNIMLVSVTERTREIGIRKSLGAKRRDIRSQFIIEAGTTSALGGVVGIGVGMAMASLAGKAVGITAITSVTSISVSFGVSLAVGVTFGYLPANKAAKLNPIDALRYD
ncbi:MAG: ABC transporter permease [Clostridiaceae bacterium]|nr:ABC transporter permease [Clostridiaceae bacterium]